MAVHWPEKVSNCHVNYDMLIVSNLSGTECSKTPVLARPVIDTKHRQQPASSNVGPCTYKNTGLSVCLSVCWHE